MDLAKIVEHLSSGGLVAILSHGMEGSPFSRAWLNLDDHANVIHTFSATIGGIGGSNIPAQALCNGKILESRHRVVIGFLQSFGLDMNQAEQITYAVGIEGRMPSAPHSIDRSRFPDKAD